MATYGRPHRKIKAKYAPAVDAGQGWCTEPICLLPNRWIQPGTPWDLAHNREQGGYRGPAHPKCNRAEGGRYRHAKARRSRWVM